MRKFDVSSVLAAMTISALAFFAFFFRSEGMTFLRVALEEGYVKTALLMAVVIIVLTHSIKVKAQNDNVRLIIRSGFAPFDIFLTLGTYYAVTTTACSLLEGAIVQGYFAEATYFTKFSTLDVYVLMGVSALLLWYVVFHTYLLAVELFFPMETPEPSTKEMHISMEPINIVTRDNESGRFR